MNRFVVVDVAENQLSWDDKVERGEVFKSEKVAMKRAAELANTEPHKAFDVFKIVARVFEERGPLKVQRFKP